MRSNNNKKKYNEKKTIKDIKSFLEAFKAFNDFCASRISWCGSPRQPYTTTKKDRA